MPRFNLPSPGKQVYMAAFLAKVHETGLHDAVRAAAKQVPPKTLRDEITAHVPSQGLVSIQGTSIRDEEVFSTPTLLRQAPGVLAYYRLLLGVSQKEFYTTKSGLNIFKPMEERQEVTDRAEPFIEELCDDLNEAMTVLLHALPPANLRANVEQLPVLTLGAQADGSWRGQIGQKATRGVFEAMKAIVKAQGKPFSETAVSITVLNNSQREVTLALAPDPDVVIREDFGNDSSEYKVAAEIKGGKDYANLHNRVGEAEKSHQKARAAGARDYWTIIDLQKADMNRLEQESPTTREWLDLTEVLEQRGPYWERLKQVTRAAMGI